MQLQEWKHWGLRRICEEDLEVCESAKFGDRNRDQLGISILCNSASIIHIFTRKSLHKEVTSGVKSRFKVAICKPY